MAALPRRVFASFLAIVVASLMLAGAAVSAGSDVIADYNDGNGTIDRCYTEAEFAEALEIIAGSGDTQQYGNAAGAIQEKQAECANPSVSPNDLPADSDDDGSLLVPILIGLVVLGAVAGAVAVGVRRRKAGR